jgi:hypothetical protein
MIPLKQIPIDKDDIKIIPSWKLEIIKIWNDKIKNLQENRK